MDLRTGRSGFLAAIAVASVLSLSAPCRAAGDPCRESAEGGDHDKAIEECTRQIEGEIKVKYPEYAYNNRGAAYASKGLYDRAIADYNRSVELNPVYATAYFNRAIAYMNTGQYGEAIADFTKVLELKPKHVAARQGREQAYAVKKQQDTPDSPAAGSSEDLRTPLQASGKGSPMHKAGKAAYRVQAGVFSHEANAVNLAGLYRGKGYATTVTNIESKDKRTLFRVLIGLFDDRKAAESLAEDLRKNHRISPLIYSTRQEARP